MAGKLTNSDMDVLAAFIGTGPKSFNLSYSIDRDGCSPQAFHKHCDNKGPTVTVLYNKQGSVYGGYTVLSWEGSGSWKTDKYSFLFRLRSSGRKMPTKFHPVKATDHIFHSERHGPTFGYSWDLGAFDSYSIAKSGGMFALNGTMNGFGKDYEAHGLSATDINNGSMNVTDLEVYSVTDADVSLRHWCKVKTIDEQLYIAVKKDLSGLQTSPLVSEYRILLLGPHGAGKSSFYNTVDSVFRERLCRRAISGLSDNGVTCMYVPYPIQSASGSKLKFRLCDTPGIGGTNGLGTDQCQLLLEGNVPDFYQFDPLSKLKNDSPELVKEPSFTKRIHCVAIAVDASTVESMSEDLKKTITSVTTLTLMKNIPVVILLTKIDKDEQTRGGKRSRGLQMSNCGETSDTSVRDIRNVKKSNSSSDEQHT